MPPANSQKKSYYLKQGDRESHDWAVADVAVVLEMSGKTCQNASVVLGAAAPVPIPAKAAERALKGKTIKAGTAKSAAEAAMERATPLEQNGYKVTIFKTLITRALMATV